MILEMRSEDYALAVNPEDGGTIEYLRWRGLDLMRSRIGQGPLNSACFPMAPFCNRIAHGVFQASGRSVRLGANMQGEPHAIHGLAWQAPWRVRGATARSCEIDYVFDGGEWPWPFRVRQRFDISAHGVRQEMDICNLSDEIMPAGLGFHPYFPCNALTRYHGLHHGEWVNSADCLPEVMSMRAAAIDWWNARPVITRPVDTVYVDRQGALSIVWPDRKLSVRMEPSALFRFTTIYVPPSADHFCVEPVSHMTNALNHPALDTGTRWLAPGASLVGDVRYVAGRA